MDGGRVVVDISSDEEFGGDESRCFADSDRPEVKTDDYNWLSELLYVFENETVDSDEVMVVREVKPTKQRSKSKPLKPPVADYDDDCMVLEGDPDKPAAVTNDSENELDELLIVGEKGQIACRDYPHPRHLCASFPFNSTPHEQHCKLCHCYVCDSIAPCAYWVGGMSNEDHCHATEKEERWRVERGNFRLRNTPTSAPPRVHDNSQTAPQLPILPQIIQPTQNPAARPPTIRRCSATKSTASSGVARDKSQQTSLSRSMLQQRPVSQLLHGLYNNGSQRANKTRDYHPPVSRLTKSNTIFKRPGSGGQSFHARTSLSSSISCNRVAHHTPRISHQESLPQPAVISDSSWLPDVHPVVSDVRCTYESPFRPNSENVIESTLASQVGTCAGAPLQNDRQQSNQHQIQSLGANRHLYRPGRQGPHQYIYQLEKQSERGANHGDLQLDSPTQNVSDLDSVFNSGWSNNASINNQASPVADFQQRDTTSSTETFPAMGSSCHSAGNIGVDAMHLETENFLSGNSSVPTTPDNSASCQFNLLPLDPEEALLFDYEFSWNALREEFCNGQSGRSFV